MKATKAFQQKFWEKVDKSDDCWLWLAATIKGGNGERKLPYGVIGSGKTPGGSSRVLLAHRVSWEFHHGPVPAGYYIDHICHNTLCVNPYHLRLATPKQNSENQSIVDSRSTSGYRGVCWSKQKNKWRAYCTHEGKQHHAGFHDSKEQAAEAARQARNKVFTHNDADRY